MTNHTSLAHNLEDERSIDVSIDTAITFDQLMLKPYVIQGLKSEEAGFQHPSPVQLESIPLGRCGLDLVLQSKSGTGKTCVFAVIALEALDFESNSTQALILAPTREIAIQISDVISLIGKKTPGLRCATLIGGTKVQQDRQKLLSNGKGCQIAVGTPGRICQLIDLNILRTNTITLFVLDEADKLMEDQFKSQINDIYKRLPQDKQMIATSATYPNELAEFISQYMQTPQFIRFGSDDPALVAIDQYYILTPPAHSNTAILNKKIDLLVDILSIMDYYQCIIFTNYQARAPIICDKLSKGNQQGDGEDNKPATLRASFICSELSQEERMKTFEQFKRSDTRVLISTDISARGIDIEGIDLIINLDLAHDISTYYHRIGRAGRFGSRGQALTLVDRGLDMKLFKQINNARMKKVTLDDLKSIKFQNKLRRHNNHGDSL